MSSRRWDGNVHVCDRPKRRKWTVEIGGFTHDENCHLILVDIFLRDARDVCLCDLLNTRAVALQKILGIAIELIIHSFAQNLFVGVETEDEGIKNRALCFSQLFWCTRVCFLKRPALR